MHDAKFSYTITAHVGWSSVKSPFLLCGCNRGEGVGNEKHECKFITKEEQLLVYEASAKHWQTIKTPTTDPKVQEKEKSTLKKWAQRYNKGITHFGLHPSLLSLSVIRCYFVTVVFSYLLL